jgi:hypothetical protein
VAQRTARVILLDRHSFLVAGGATGAGARDVAPMDSDPAIALWRYSQHGAFGLFRIFGQAPLSPV